MTSEKLSQPVIQSINKLMQLNYTAEKTFDSVDRNLHPEGFLDTHLKKQAKMHHDYQKELRDLLEKHYLKPAEVADFFSDVFDSMAMKLTAMLTTDDKRVLLKKCQQTQMNMLDDYDKAVQLPELPEEVCKLLENEFMCIKQSIAETKKLLESLVE